MCTLTTTASAGSTASPRPNNINDANGHRTGVAGAAAVINNDVLHQSICALVDADVVPVAADTSALALPRRPVAGPSTTR
jgi:hypothetical protein